MDNIISHERIEYKHKSNIIYVADIKYVARLRHTFIYEM